MAKRELLYRRNAVLEALRGSRREIRRLWLQKDANERQLKPLVEAAEGRGVPIQRSSKSHLTNLAGDEGHQGAVLEVGPYIYAEVGEILGMAAGRGEQPFLLLLDLIHGPHNVGILLRTAEACGVHGVVIQERRAPEITPQIVIASAGAAEHLLVAQVTNLVQTMEQLKEEEVWLAGLDVDINAQRLGEIDLNMPLGIVVGHEGEGLRRLVRQHCDFLLQLPMRGKVESLNAAVAGSIVLYAAWQARGSQGAPG